MQPAAPNHPEREPFWRATLAAIALSWVPTLLFLGLSSRQAWESLALPASALGLLALVSVYSFSRHKHWSGILWLPLVLGLGMGGFAALMGFLSTSSHAGPSAAPLDGVASLILLVLFVGAVAAAVTGGFLRPKSLPTPILVLGLLNAGLMFILTTAGHRGVHSLEMHLHLRDPSGKPLAGVAVDFVREGYGNEGKRVLDTSGGPIHSDETGLVKIPTLRGRYETSLTLKRSGFRPIKAVVEMPYSQPLPERFWFSTDETRAISGGAILPGGNPSFTLFLSPTSHIPSPAVQRYNLRSRSDLAREVMPQSLDLDTGKFLPDLSGDLALEFFSATITRYRDQKIRLRGLGGTQLQVPSETTTDLEPLELYERTYRFAPKDHYLEEVTLESQKGTVFIRGADGKRHALLFLEGLGDGVQEVPRYTGSLVVNPDGRHLE